MNTIIENYIDELNAISLRLQKGENMSDYSQDMVRGMIIAVREIERRLKESN